MSPDRGPHPDDPARQASHHHRLLLALTLAHLLVDLGQGSVPALGPYLRDARGLTYTQVGALALATSATASALQPLAGIYSDRSPGGRLIVAGLAAVGLGLAGAALAPSFPLLLTSVALVGLGVALFHPEAMRAAHELGGRGRATTMALFQVGGNAGYGLGPGLAGLLLLALGQPGLVLAAVPVAAWAAVTARLLPSLREAGVLGPGAVRAPSRAAEAPSRAAGVARTAGAEDRWPDLAKVLAVIMLRSVLQLSLVAFAPLYYVDVLGGDPRWAGLLVSLYLLSGAAGTLAGGPLADRIGLRRYVLLAMLALLPLHGLTLAARGAWAAVALAAQGFVLVSTFAPSVVLSQTSLPSRPALAAGLNVGLGIGAGGIGAGVMGLLADRAGLVPAMYALLAVPAAAAAFAALLPEPGRRAGGSGERTRSGPAVGAPEP